MARATSPSPLPSPPRRDGLAFVSEDTSAPRPRRRRARGADEAPEPASPEQTFRLRESSIVLGVVLLVVGVPLAGLGGLALLAGPGTLSCLLAGFGLAFGGAGYAVIFQRQSIRQVTVGPAGIRIDANDGSSATLPCAAVKGATMHEVVTSSTSSSSGQRTTSVTYHVQLDKLDGGAITLGAQPDQGEAYRLAVDMTAAIERSRGAGDTAPKDALAILSEARGIAARRDDGEGSADYRTAARRGDLVIGWSLHPRHYEVVPALCVPAGFALAIYGFSFENRTPFLLVMAVAVTALFLFLFWHLLRRAGASQILRISDAELTAFEQRGSRRADEKTLPLATIAAVDFSLTSQAMGGELQIRRHDAAVPALPAPSDFASLDGVVTLAKKALDVHRNTVKIPLGRLPLGDRIRVDLAVSAEIAQRTARDDAEL